MDDLVAEVSAHSLRQRSRARIVLPDREIQPDTEARVRHAIDRYCALRLVENANELRTLRREGLGALAIGGVILVLGLFLSGFLSRSSVPTTVRDYLGQGVFLVVAWVGLWYPLDTLLWTPRVQVRHRKVLHTIRNMEVTVEPASSAAVETAGPGPGVGEALGPGPGG
jgi:hypothetical protein